MENISDGGREFEFENGYESYFFWTSDIIYIYLISDHIIGGSGEQINISYFYYILFAKPGSLGR